MKTEAKRFSYGVGAIAVLAISLAVALISYGLALLPYDFFNLLGWLFGPLESTRLSIRSRRETSQRTT